MLKNIITLSAIAAMATTSFASTEVQSQLDEMSKKIIKLEKQLKKNKRTLRDVKQQANNDNIKFDVDFRTALDSIQYDHVSGKESKNSDLLTNRLWLGMGYAPDANNLFKGKLSYNKAYGDTANHSQSNSPMGVGFANFDWITNENATDNTVKVKEAYWLYMNDTFLGTEIPWTISMGRRPSTDGLGINLREGMKDNSPLSHTVNTEFDGGSAKFTLSELSGVEGMWFKLCAGRGLTNATPRFNMTIPGADYVEDKTKSDDIDMYGFIFVPYDNGQYSVHMNWANAVNLIGFTNQSMQQFGMASQGYDPNSGTAQSGGMPTKYLNGSATADETGTPKAVQNGYDANGNYYQNNNSLIPAAMMANAPQFQNFGDMELFTIMAKAEGIGDGINDFLDDTIVFASWAQSKTNPNNNMNMLGSNDSETGNSTWLGVNMPCLLTDGRFGLEWNKGSKYWRSVTYAEDTLAGSKIATRGTAFEVYYNKSLTKALNLNIRYTKMDYDYTGSNSFFGEDGTPMSIRDAKAAYEAGTGPDVVESASDIRVSISYRY